MTLDHVSDTALLVAAARAIETMRPDGLVRDPHALLLAGERGMALSEKARSECGWNSLGIGLRSRFMDELLIAELSRSSIDCVLSLGAGLDSRPWRLLLPENLRWIEVDFDHILDYKHRALSDIPPRCKVERLSMDLNDAGQRQALLTRTIPPDSRTLLLTEGLLIFLPPSTVIGLANEALAQASVVSWLLDVTSACVLESAAVMGKLIESVAHETHLSGDQILRTLIQSGWGLLDRRTCIRAGATFMAARTEEYANGLTPSPQAVPANDPTGVWLLSRHL